MKTVRSLAGVGVLLVLALPLACVNPFKPADPEQPDSSGVFEDYHDIEPLLRTMERAVASKSTGGTNAWLHALADSQLAGDRAFRAFYDPAVKENWETGTSLRAPEPWDLSLERNLPSKLFGIRPLASYAFQFLPDHSGSGLDDISPDTALIHRQYLLIATQGNNVDTIGNGYCDLSLQKVSSRWSIVHWFDRLNPLVGVNPSGPARTMSWWRLESLAR